MTNKQRARVAMVPVGLIEIEGLKLTDGTYAVAASQLAQMFEPSTKRHRNSSRWLNSLLNSLPEGIPQSVTSIDGKEGATVTVLTLDEFRDAVKALVQRGNKPAIEFMSLLFGLSLEQLFADAFGDKMDAHDRQAYLRRAQDINKAFNRKFGWGDLETAKLHNKMTVSLFGKTARELVRTQPHIHVEASSTLGWTHLYPHQLEVFLDAKAIMLKSTLTDQDELVGEAVSKLALTRPIPVR